MTSSSSKTLLVMASAKPKEEELSLFTMSEHKVMDLIYATHVHDDQSFDDDSLFLVVQNILKHSTQIVDKLVQGTQVHVEQIEDETLKAIVPLCKLKKIGSEMCCKAPSEEIVHKSTMSILNNLSSYSWEAKAVLTLAAFALEYGDFWLLATLHHSDQLAKSLAILKRLPHLIEPPELQKRRKYVLELNNLIKDVLQVVEIIFEFEKLSAIYGSKDVPALAVAVKHIAVDVYWAILAVVACGIKISLLTSDEYQAQDLSPYSQKIHYTISKYKIQLTVCRKQIKEEETYRRLCKLLQTPTEIMEVFKALIFTKDNVQPLIDGSSNKTVEIDVLRRKNVLLLFSGLDISDEDISILKPIYEGTKRDGHYKIVWIPIVDLWTEDLRKKFEILRAKMPWYVVQLSSRIAGLKFIKEQWNFKGKPIVVVMNSQGKVENPNALHLIRVWGMKAFPFNKAAEEAVSKDKSWIGLATHHIDPSIQGSMKEDKYIFFYGGKDNEWLKQFTNKVASLANDPTIKGARISIELFHVGGKGSGHGVLGKFWNTVEGLFFTKAQEDKELDPVTQEIQKLLSYKNDKGWFVLSKGSTVVLAGHGFTILKVLEEFEGWKKHVGGKDLDVIIKDNHGKILVAGRQCCQIDVPIVAGKMPEMMKCPECPRSMETFVSYKCCHVDDAMTAHH
ncbi:hypothetical protein UlMin_009823 [Ulmus minor]